MFIAIAICSRVFKEQVPAWGNQWLTHSTVAGCPDRRHGSRAHSGARALSDLMADNAVVSLDCGANTHFAARSIRLRANQRFTGTGMLATMAPGVSFAMAAQLPIPIGNPSLSPEMAALPC